MNTPGLMSAAAIRAALLKEENEKKSLRKEISTENIKEIWNKYTSELSSKSTKNALTNTQLSFSEKTIQVYVPTLFIKELLMQETKLMDEIRSTFHIEDLILKVDVDKNKFPEYEELSAIKLKMSAKDIYKKMTEKNPVLIDFIKTLDLKPEGE